MPSEIGYPLPPSGQRPQLQNRVDLQESRNLLKVTDDDQLKSSGVELNRVKVVTATREVLDDRFPSEGQVEQFRGNTEGRNLKEIPASLPLTRLPSRVQAFNPLSARSDALSSLSIAESAATGLTPPQPSINIGVAGTEAKRFGPNQAPNGQSRLQGPAINGSGEIAARFEAIEERLRQRALDEFDSLRPGGPDSEELSIERVSAEQITEDIRTEDKRREFNQVDLQLSQRRLDQRISDQNQENRAFEARLVEEKVIDRAVEQVNQEQEEIEGLNSENPVAVKPGEPTDSRGQPLSSEEQQEVRRLRRRDQEVRAHEQAHARAGGAHVRGGVQLSYSTGPDGRRYATDGEVNVDLSSELSPEQTIAKMRQIQGAALAPAEPSGADRAVASAAARKLRDAQSQAQELKRADLESQVKKTEEDGAVQQSESERAGKVEMRENADHFAGAQSVNPDQNFSPRSSGIDQQALEGLDGIHPLSSPRESSRPVTGPTKKLSIEEQKPSAASPRSEGPSQEYDRAIDRAMGRS